MTMAEQVMAITSVDGRPLPEEFATSPFVTYYPP